MPTLRLLRLAAPAVVLVALGCASHPSSPAGGHAAAPPPSSARPAVHAPASSPSAATELPATTLPVPGGASGANFDDMQLDAKAGKVLVPAGLTGNLDVIDPATHAITAIAGFSTQVPKGRHFGGTTSVSAGAGYWFATDRTTRTVSIVDPKKGVVIGKATLAGGPDYVRWVEPLREVWVTEPHDGRIEVFAFAGGPRPSLTSKGTFSVPDGPESLVIDATRGRAYTNDEDKRKTEAIDLKSHALLATWDSGCTKRASGLIEDAAHGYLVVGCGEGAASVIDAAHEGARLSYLAAVQGTDIIAYDPVRRHVYVPGARSATLAIMGLSDRGTLSLLGLAQGAKRGHCVVADDQGDAYVCDPLHGQLLFVRDPFPASR